MILHKVTFVSLVFLICDSVSAGTQRRSYKSAARSGLPIVRIIITQLLYHVSKLTGTIYFAMALTNEFLVYRASISEARDNTGPVWQPTSNQALSISRHHFNIALW